MKFIINSLICCFYSLHLLSQVDVNFITHLNTHNLTREHRAYLASLPKDTDTIRYYKAKFYLKQHEDSLFINQFKAGLLMCQKDSSLIRLADAYFLTHPQRYYQTQWFEKFEVHSVSFLTAYLASQNPNAYPLHSFPEKLQPAFQKYKKSYNKSPWLAAGLSMVLPGSGKLYAGKRKTFFLTFLLNVVYAAQSYESIRYLGIKHPLSIINVGAFSVFYLSNIYGSYTSVRQLRGERKKQFLTNVETYYN